MSNVLIPASYGSKMGSITRLIVDVKGGNEDAAQRLWDRYFRRLVALARKKLGAVPKKAADEEDVVVNAFDSVVRGIKVDRFKKLENREDLWQILALITVRKSINQRRWVLAEKHGGGKVRGESVFEEHRQEGGDDAGIAEAIAAKPDDEVLAEFKEECERLLDLLDDEQCQVAQLRLEGYTVQEIADKLGCNKWRIERKLQIIRRKWS